MKNKYLNFSHLLGLFSILICLLVTAFIISPTLHYHVQQIAFLPQFAFFSNFIDYPGGIADYIADFISQFFNFNLVGSIIIVGIACTQAFLILSIFRNLKISIKSEILVLSMTLILSIVVLCNYYYPYYASIRLFFSTIFIWGYSKLNLSNQTLKTTFWVLMAVLLFYLAGGFALIVFSLSSLFIFFIEKDKKVKGWYFPPIVLFMAFLPYLSYKLIFPLNIGNLYNIILFKPPAMLTYTPDFTIYLSYFFLPFLLLWFLFYLKYLNKLRLFQMFEAFASNSMKKFAFLQFTIILLVGILLFAKPFASFKKEIIQIDYYAEHGDWKNILKTASKIPVYEMSVNYQVNRALANLGILPDKLFEYPQIKGSQGLFVDDVLELSASMPISDFYFDLGFMAESQHWAFEAQTLIPNSPRILKRLVLINLINRDYKLAEKYLAILDQNMLYHNWVNSYEKYIQNPELTDNNSIFAEKRQFSPVNYAINSGSTEWMKLLFETNHQNKLAYEYLMCNLILDSRLKEFIEYLPYSKSFNYTELPKSWQEAACYYYASTNVKPENYVTNNCINAFNAINHELKPFKNNLSAGKTAIQKKFGKTYWYYLLYISPVTLKNLQQK